MGTLAFLPLNRILPLASLLQNQSYALSYAILCHFLRKDQSDVNYPIFRLAMLYSRRHLCGSGVQVVSADFVPHSALSLVAESLSGMLRESMGVLCQRDLFGVSRDRRRNTSRRLTLAWIWQRYSMAKDTEVERG